MLPLLSLLFHYIHTISTISDKIKGDFDRMDNSFHHDRWDIARVSHQSNCHQTVKVVT